MNNQLFKRKFLFSLMAVVMCLGFVAMSYGAATVSVDPATVESPAVGEQFTVNINIAGGAGVAGFQATVNYDSTALSYVSAAKGDYIPGDPAAGTFFPILRPGDSLVVISGTSIGAGTGEGDGTLASVTFQVVEVKASSISLSDVTVSDAGANELEVTSADGAVTVPEPTVPEPTDPEPTDPEPTDPEPTDPEPTDPEPTDPEPTDPEPTDPEPTDPEPTDPEPVVPEPQVFKITLTNLTEGQPGMGGQIFSPPIFATHTAGVKIYEVGQPANAALVALAEGGDVSGLAALAAAAGANSVVGEGMVFPGASVTIMITADSMNSALSLATMLVSTNDAFIGTTDLALFDEAGMPISTTLELRSYDAGSEENTELGTDIPGPVGLSVDEDPMGSNARVPTEGGVIASHPGIMGVGDVGESFAWTEPTAMLSVEPYVPEPEPVPEPQIFAITLTNLTEGEPGMGGQIFSPPIFATHVGGVKIYEVGKEANDALVALAEGGDVSGLAALAAAAGANSVVGDGMVHPGASVTVMLTADSMNSALSLATMLVSTNDAFIGVADLALFDDAAMPISTTLHLRSYDAGSEQNTERGTDIPGPVGLSADEDPMGSNARVPTEGGVITSHPGIMGVGDVLPSFAWTEPTAMLTIEPYVPEPDPEPAIPTYDVKLASGLNMISVPLMPAEPYTAKSLAEMLGSTVVVKLDGYSQSFVGYVVAEDDDGFAIEGGKGYIVNTPEGKTVTFSGNAWSNEPAEMDSEEAAAAPKINTAQDAWAFVLTSNLQDQVSGATYTMVAKNLRTGVVTTEKVTNDNGRVTAVWADLNRKSVVEAGDKVEISLVDENGTVVSGPFERTVQTSDINNAFLSVQMRVGDVRPKDTVLGQNFPNPFNPETWIPYQLNRDSIVTIEIYGASGSLVRTLDLGHKSVGAYMTSSNAAYWDGKNNAGESVASGIYFYTLKTDDFSTTRKMVILK